MAHWLDQICCEVCGHEGPFSQDPKLLYALAQAQGFVYYKACSGEHTFYRWECRSCSRRLPKFIKEAEVK